MVILGVLSMPISEKEVEPEPEKIVTFPINISEAKIFRQQLVEKGDAEEILAFDEFSANMFRYDETPGNLYSSLHKTDKLGYYGCNDTLNGKITAYGEIFDESKYTISTDQLPYNSKARVVNKETGDQIIVEVKDKSDNTVLSCAAFRHIADLSEGLINADIYLLDKTAKTN